jgi:hypothetical protein
MSWRKIAVSIAALAFLAAAPIALASAASTPSNRPTVRWVWMTGEKEVPPGDTDGAGVASVFLSPASNKVCWVVHVKRITLPATLMHIHPGAPGAVGPPLITMTPPDASGNSFGCVTSADVDAVAANPHGYYINVHTSDHPAGALRGQL